MIVDFMILGVVGIVSFDMNLSVYYLARIKSAYPISSLKPY
jgi:hypothetical protein